MVIGIPCTLSGKLAMGVLVGMAAVHAYSTFMLEGELPLFAIILELILLAVAAMFSGLLFLLALLGPASTLTSLSEPAFPSVLAFLVLGFVAAIAGIRSAGQGRKAR
jgi:hypothetical protein